MIHYAVRCGAGHDFDGWFPGSDAFDRQVADGLVECPRCGSAQVTRALMAPSIGRASVEVLPPEPPKKMPAEVRTALQGLRAAVEKNCDYVGDQFADQALRMHQGDLDYRGIYGESTEEEADRLRDEGVPVGRIPWVPRADS